MDGWNSFTQRKIVRTREDEAALCVDIVELAKAYGRCGYRRVTARLRHAGWMVNAKRVQRIWRQEGLKVPQKQPKRGRLKPSSLAPGASRHGPARQPLSARPLKP